MIADFAGSDQELLEVMARLRAAGFPRNLAGWDPSLTRYLDAAMAALDAGDGDAAAAH